jgi:hypothetical protein
MAKTTFSSGVIVTSQWLNGAQQIYFDGQDLDWHYPPLGLSSLVISGPNGLDNRYITLGTDQPTVVAGVYQSGISISGSKVVTGPWGYGYDPSLVGNPANIIANAPKSFTTNSKYDNAGGNNPSTIPQRWAALAAEDLVTKKTVDEFLSYSLDTLNIDNGIYESATNPACHNYSVGTGNSDTICPV